jgi:hypothetical protein
LPPLVRALHCFATVKKVFWRMHQLQFRLLRLLAVPDGICWKKGGDFLSHFERYLKRFLDLIHLKMHIEFSNTYFKN